MLNQLRLDHANMARMLHVLQLKHKTLAKGERPDFQLMREVVDYILSYMDGFATPLERICVERLKTQAPEHLPLMEQMASDYRELKPRLMRLSQDIDMILMDNILPMDRFADDLKAYLEATELSAPRAGGAFPADRPAFQRRGYGGAAPSAARRR